MVRRMILGVALVLTGTACGRVRYQRVGEDAPTRGGIDARLLRDAEASRDAVDAGVSDETDASREAGMDGDPDVGLYAGRDVGRDVGVDAGIDGGLDMGVDAGIDGGLDTGRDVGVDAGRDVGVDAGRDVGFDGGRDVGVDTGIDAGRDVGFDGGRDVGVDTGIDAGRDVGFDGGLDAARRCRSLVVEDFSAGFPGYLGLGTGAFTFEAWVRTSSNSSVQIALADRVSGSGLRGHLFGILAQRPFMQLSDTPNIDWGPTITDGVWHHIALVRDAGQRLSAYTDFTPHTPLASSSARDLPQQTSVTLGEDTFGGSRFMGHIHMVRVWNVPRALDELIATGGAGQTAVGTVGLVFEFAAMTTSETTLEAWVQTSTMSGVRAATSTTGTLRFGSTCPSPRGS